MRKKIGIHIVIFSLVFIFLLTSSSCVFKKSGSFNIVLIVIDALRSDHLPFYGYHKNTAPFLKKIAGQSVLFKNAFSASSWTAPGTASIFTSLYPFQHGVLMGLLAAKKHQKFDPNIKINKIPAEITTITELLKNRGYKTYGISDNLNIGERQGFHQGFDRFITYNYKSAKTVNKTLKEWQPEIQKNGKYFIYLHYMDPHAPYNWRKPWYQPQKEYRADKISAYDSEINYADVHIEEMFKLFEWDKNTLVIITSDHGEGLWDHGRMGHGGSLYREQIQVPLFFLLPNKKKGKEVAVNVNTIDILPTVRGLLGMKGDESLAGKSLVPLIRDETNNLDNRYIFSYLWKKWATDTPGSFFEVEYRSAIYKTWHYQIKLPQRRQLFNLMRDTKERNNRVRQGKKIAALLEVKFNDYFKTSKKFQQQTTDFQLDEEALKKLKQLGYITSTPKKPKKKKKK